MSPTVTVTFFFYVRNEDLYKILYETHVNVGNGGKHRNDFSHYREAEIFQKCFRFSFRWFYK
jgi:hypothetical protein